MGDDDLVMGGTEAEEQVAVEDATVPCEFLTGVAGSGKTFSVLQAVAADPSWGMVCATTGIAAVNLSTVTVNSTLGFFDTDSLRDLYLTGGLSRRLRQIREDYRRLVIDEVSMMDGEQLSLLVRATLEANAWKMDAPPLGLLLTGDFCQLPPVKARWAFESDEWHRFESATTRLNKVWRQDAGRFLDALNLARAGRGAESAEVLTAEGLEWHSVLDISFDGTTLVSKNDQVSRYNLQALDRLPSKPFTLTSRRWGKQRGEWGQNRRTGEWGIPPALTLKVDAYVMLLSNCYSDRYESDSRELVFANGDCGWIVEQRPDSLLVRLARNNREVEVTRIVRDLSVKDKPEGLSDMGRQDGYVPRPHRDAKGRYVLGQVEYFPLRLAWATSVHKSQSLSLDAVQVDIRDRFFSSYGMAYVALSRCRSLAGLRIVGQRERYVSQVKTDPRVERWL